MINISLHIRKLPPATFFGGVGVVFWSKLWSSQIWSFSFGGLGGGLSGLKFQKFFWRIGTKIYCLRSTVQKPACASQIVSHILRMWRLMTITNFNPKNCMICTCIETTTSEQKKLLFWKLHSYKEPESHKTNCWSVPWGIMYDSDLF